MVRDLLSLPEWMSVASTAHHDVCCRNLATGANLLGRAVVGAQNLCLELALSAEPNRDVDGRKRASDCDSCASTLSMQKRLGFPAV